MNTRTEDNMEKSSSLRAIALQYENSDSDVEDASDDSNNREIEIPVCDKNSYRNIQEDSDSNASSDSEDSSDSDSSTSTNDADSDADSDESSNAKDKNSSKTVTHIPRNKEPKSELDNLPPIEDLKINVPEVLCDPLGEIAWIVEQLVVVKPKKGKPTLNLDSVLFIDKGKKALGKIFDVFGKVNDPHYSIRFNSPKHIEENNIKVGMTVYYCPNTEYTSLVFLHELMKMKGSDTVDEGEPPEFSDDEKEKAYYEALKQKNKQNKTNGNALNKRKRTTSNPTGWQSKHPWNKNTNSQLPKNNHFYARNGNRHNPNPVWRPNTYQNNYCHPMQRPMYPAYVQGPRIPFGASPQFTVGVAPLHGPPIFTPPPRFPYMDAPLRPMVPVPFRMPWIDPQSHTSELPPPTLPPPPPPPPPPSSM